MSAMVNASPAMKGWRARWASSSAISGSVAATDFSINAGSRRSAGVRKNWTKAGRPAGFSVVCCQSIQRSASKRRSRFSG